MSKSGEYFRFKQFSVKHDRCTMKVGTDGVLLGAWGDVNHAGHILDIGTGSGVIALMLAQRTSGNVLIDAVESSTNDATQARENVEASPWNDRVKIYHTSIQDFKPASRYDLIVSNPPYFNNSQKPPDERRVETRHTTTLDFPTLLTCVTRLLNDNGIFAVILPYTEGLEFIGLAAGHQLHCIRKTSFRTRKEKPVERWLLEFSRHNQQPAESEILLYQHDLEWSDGYRSLTGEFYLKA